MKQKTIIEINSNKPLDQLSNHILFWDSTKKCYYATTLEEFLKPQNDKIKQLEAQNQQLAKLFEQFRKSILSDYNEFKNTMLQEKQDFLATYKDTNAKIIEMVKSFVTEEEGE